ncbi:Ig-like domain-containing protein [candidate division KSB1 bacterium]|nr:Ig-like domain-containing protein [candidate division KSB1 bacterium]
MKTQGLNDLLQKRFSILLAVGIFILSVQAWSIEANIDDSQNGGRRAEYSVVIEPDSVVLQIGETQQFEAYLEDSSGTRKDTTFQWSTTGGRNGIITDAGLFTALKPGVVHVIASAGRLSGSAWVQVVDDSVITRNGYRVIVVPHDTLLLSGNSAQFSAYLTDTSDTRIDTVFTWSLSTDSVGIVDANGLFSANQKGHTKVIASVSDMQGWGHAIVIEDSTHWVNRTDGLKINVEPSSVVLAVGDTLTFAAVCTDTQGYVIDTTFTWSVDGDFAIISAAGLLEAIGEGNGFVYASAGDVSGRAHIRVRTSPDDPDQRGNNRLYNVVINPVDTTLLIGETLQFEAFLEDTLGNRYDTTMTWAMRGRTVGTLTQTGFFTAESRGVGMIQASVEKYQAVTRVVVVSESDLAECDTVQIRFHDRDGIQVGNIRRIEESDILKISGLPFPLNILNGGELVLPPGSLAEGISIEITLPDLAEIQGDTAVTFVDSVIAGFSFDVYVNGILISPYVFDTPVQVVLPYKPEMMEALGLTLEDFAIFFYNEDGTFDDADIFNVFVDTTNNKVYAEVAHFSQVIFASQSGLSTDVNSHGSQSPSHYQLYENYPNPFNPDTWIAFDVAGSGEQHVILTVYNMLGQRVQTLVDKSSQPGHYLVHWDGQDLSGNRVATGVYLYRLETEAHTLTRRMLLLQ